MDRSTKSYDHFSCSIMLTVSSKIYIPGMNQLVVGLLNKAGDYSFTMLLAYIHVYNDTI